MLYMPITPIIQAYYANAETSHEMHYRDYCLKQALNALAVSVGVKKPNLIIISAIIMNWDYFMMQGILH